MSAQCEVFIKTLASSSAIKPGSKNFSYKNKKRIFKNLGQFSTTAEIKLKKIVWLCKTDRALSMLRCTSDLIVAASSNV